MLTVLRDLTYQPWVPDDARPKSARAFRRGLYVLIQRAVFKGKSTTGGHLNPLIKICRKNFEHTTWATFNWDCIFEASFWYSQPYYGPGTPRVNPSLAIKMANWRTGSKKHMLLKLHGGINWWDIDGKITYCEWSSGGSLEQKWDEYDKNEVPSKSV